MMRFQLPVFSPDMGLNEAFAELCEIKVSGLVIPRSRHKYQLISFDHMTEALAHGAQRLDLVNGYTLPFLEDVSDQEANKFMITLGGTVGLLNVYEQNANLFSISERVAGGYLFSSSVVRCDRPNKPPGQPNPTWYHYYPPSKFPWPRPPRPHKCVEPGCLGMVR